jgi:phosphoglycolate phosphatase
MKKFWFFDLDGTLADTDGDIRLSWKAAMAELGLFAAGFDEKFVAGPPIEEMARRLFPDAYTPELGLALREAFGRHYDTGGFPATREYPGVLDRVRALKAQGACVCIVTNKRYKGACALAEKFAWGDVFDGVYAGDMYQDDPAIGKLRKGALLRRLTRHLQAPPDACVMVGDTISDFEAARENAISSVAVSWGYGTPAERAQADVRIETPAALSSALF